jgi:Zn-dependent protease with chaperone function
MDVDSGQNQPSPAPRQNGELASGRAPFIASMVLVLAVPLVALAVLACWAVPIVPWWLGIPLGVAAAALVVAAALRNAAGSRIRELDAVPAGPDEYARFHNVVQGLSLAGGISEPDLYVLDDGARNLACVADRGQSAIVATTGLLAALDRIGLEGVMAAAVVRIRSGDAAAATLGAALFGRMLSGPTATLLEPAATLGFRRLLDADRDLAADRAAVTLTRYPPGLLAAFTVIRSGTVRPAACSPVNEHLWLIPPTSPDHRPEGAVRTTPLDLRIDVLAEL